MGMDNPMSKKHKKSHLTKVRVFHPQLSTKEWCERGRKEYTQSYEAERRAFSTDLFLSSHAIQNVKSSIKTMFQDEFSDLFRVQLDVVFLLHVLRPA